MSMKTQFFKKAIKKRRMIRSISCIRIELLVTPQTFFSHLSLSPLICLNQIPRHFPRFLFASSSKSNLSAKTTNSIYKTYPEISFLIDFTSINPSPRITPLAEAIEEFPKCFPPLPCRFPPSSQNGLRKASTTHRFPA